MRRLRLISAAGLALALAPGSPVGVLAGVEVQAAAQMNSAKRLILKDGTYQIVSRYEVHGDRVKYLSAERGEWEEIPYNLIDWPATDKWNKAHEPGAKAAPSPTVGTSGANAGGQSGSQNNGQNGNEGMGEAAAIDRAAAAEKADQQARTPKVATGLRLPDQDGIFVLDNFQDIPELIHLDQTAGNVNREASHNVLRAAVSSFRGAQEPVRIQGQAAKVRVHVNEPVLYVSLDTNNAEQVAPESALVVDTHGESSSKDDKNSYSSPESHYAIVRVDVHPGERVIGAVRISRVGNVTQSEDIVPTNAEILPGRHWMKLTPKDPLGVGEYALMEILSPGVINLDVWDFGVSPNSPENKHPITPVKDGGG